jgi:hypothetical protein
MTERIKKKENVNVKFILEKATMAPKGSRGVAVLFFFNRSARCGGWSTPRLGRFTPGKDPVVLV